MEFQSDLNLQRWLIYLVFGVPVLAWVFLTRNRILRLTAVVGVLVFVQQSLVSRRYVWAFGVGPAIIFAYVALVSSMLQSRRLPRLGALPLLWSAFLFSALIGLAVGSLGSGLLLWNVIAFQDFYVESAVLFFVGAFALSGMEEFRKVPAMLVWLGLGVSITHLACVATGYRFPDWPASMARDSYWFQYGGVFTNVNTLANAILLTMPVSVSVAADGRERFPLRVLAGVATVAMGVSLILTSARGPYGFAVLLCSVALFARRTGFLTSLLGAIALTLVLALTYFATVDLFADAFGDVLEDLRLTGLATDRPLIWLGYLSLVVSHPFGVGLTEQNVWPYIGQFSLRYELAHNIYLDIAARAGIAGALCFIALLAGIFMRVIRGIRFASDPRDRTLMQRLLLVVIAYPMGGLVEPIFQNSYKLTQLYFLLCGIAVAAATAVLAARRTEAAQAVATSDPFGSWMEPVGVPRTARE